MCGGDDHLTWKRRLFGGMQRVGQEIGSQQSRPPVVQDEMPHDSLPPLPPPPVPTVPQASPYLLHVYRPSLGCLTLRGTQALVSSHSPSTLQHSDEGPQIGQVTDDHLIPTISEWSGPAMVRVFGVLTAQDMR
ncbi:hypothetical protein AAG906_026295 [Vitis piasezkii]